MRERGARIYLTAFFPGGTEEEVRGIDKREEEGDGESNPAGFRTSQLPSRLPSSFAAAAAAASVSYRTTSLNLCLLFVAITFASVAAAATVC